MRKLSAFVLSACLLLGLFAGCSQVPGISVTSAADPSEESTEPSAEETAESSQTAEAGFDYDAVDDYMTTVDGVYSIAYVTDGGAMRDGARNQNAWEGVKRYASENGKSYKCYQTYGREAARSEDRYEAMKEAVEGGAELVICAGPEQEQALRRIAQENPAVHFVFLEGFPLKDLNGNAMTNVLPVGFREEQIGYLAGYAAVKEGMTHLGFLSSESAYANRIGSGFLQGANTAAGEMETTVTVNFHQEKKAEDSEELRAMLKQWYEDGTELIFTCGGALHRSAAAVAENSHGTTIPAEMEPANTASLFRMRRNLRDAAFHACETFYNGGWEEIGGGMELGAESDAVGLVTDPWNLKQFSLEDYSSVLAQLKDGSVVVETDGKAVPSDALISNLTLNLE